MSRPELDLNCMGCGAALTTVARYGQRCPACGGRLDAPLETIAGVSAPWGIDPTNRFGVAVLGDSIVLLLPPRRMTRAQALTFAAWLVVLADDDDPPQFPEHLKAVQNT